MGYKSGMGKCRRREEKGILAASTDMTGHHSETSIRLLNRRPEQVSGQRSGLALSYGREVTGALRVVLDATNRLFTKRLQTFIPELVDIPLGHGRTQGNTR